MIVEEKIQIKGNDYIKRYSDKHCYIERDDIMYEEAIDPYELKDERIYTETDIPIEPEEELKLVPDSDVESNDDSDVESNDDEGGDQ